MLCFASLMSSITHYSDIILSSWRLKSQATRLFVQRLVRANKLRNTWAPNYWPSMRGIDRCLVESLQKGPAIRKRILTYILHFIHLFYWMVCFGSLIRLYNFRATDSTASITIKNYKSWGQCVINTDWRHFLPSAGTVYQYLNKEGKTNTIP